MVKHGNISQVRLSGAKLTDKSVEHLTTLPGLKHVSLSGDTFTGRAIKEIGKIMRLEGLELGGTSAIESS